MSRAYKEYLDSLLPGEAAVSPAEFTRLRCGPGMTKQSFKDECDINRIVTSFDRDGVLTHLSERVPVFADVSEIGDYRSAMEQLRGADAFFGTLPAKVREAFGNDAAELVDALLDPARRGELEELGLVKKKEPAPGAPAPSVPAAPAPAQ